jgi:inorganic phosphate transporter, PiT family
VDAVAIAAALGLAFALGVSDAPNATAALVASRAAPWHVALLFSGVLHAVGALAGGTAVALTMTHLVGVPHGDVASVVAAGCLAAVAFGGAAARIGIPTSATYGLVGGLVGASLVSSGLDGVRWGGVDGARPDGVLAVLVGLVLSPAVGAAAGWLVRRAVTRGAARGTRRLLGPVRGGIWLTSGLVALSDGTNDGQKAMGMAVAVLVARGSVDSFEVPFWARGSVALALGLGTAVGGGRVIRRVSRGYYRPQPLDSLAAQASAAGVIFGAAAAGAPVSTSTVVASAVVGVGIDRRLRHVRWEAVVQTATAWLVTVPVCTALGAALFACATLVR